jgi:uncharacterized protein (TIGR03067 family)
LGQWKIVETEQHLERHPAPKESSGIVTFYQREVVFKNGEDVCKGTYRTSEGKDPKGIEMKLERDRETLLALGIYRFRKGKLELCTCTDEDRGDVFVFSPPEFKSDKSDGRVLLMVLERVDRKHNVE